ncbi:hypothetical protein M422DRAFT_90591, partial [Sphaerobolus stellatus SS14]
HAEDLPMKDIYDGWAWRAIQANLERRRGGRWTMEDVSINNISQRFVSLPCGLVLAINIDWFQTITAGCHSTGAMYVTIKNNPPALQYLMEETILICVIPGPHEPSLEQLNYILEPFVEGVQLLYQGVCIQMDVHSFEEKQPIHATLLMDISDLPASRKVAGLAGHSSELCFCPFC